MKTIVLIKSNIKGLKRREKHTFNTFMLNDVLLLSDASVPAHLWFACGGQQLTD